MTWLAGPFHLDPLDWVALAVIVWLALAIVAGPIIGTFIDRAAKIADPRHRRRCRARRRRKRSERRALGYRPPRD